MRIAVLISFAVSGLAATGCSVTKQAAAPAPVYVAADFTPPGEMDLQIGEVAERGRAQNVEALAQPNRNEIPRHQVHAAT